MIAFANPYKHPRLQSAEAIAKLLVRQPIAAASTLPQSADMSAMDIEVGRHTIGSFLMNFSDQPDTLPAGSAGAELLHYLERQAHQPDKTSLPRDERFAQGFKELADHADEMKMVARTPWLAHPNTKKSALEIAIDKISQYWIDHKNDVEESAITLPNGIRDAVEMANNPNELYALAKKFTERVDFETYCPLPECYADFLEATRQGAKAIEPVYREIMRASEAIADKLGIDLPARGRTPS